MSDEQCEHVGVCVSLCVCVCIMIQTQGFSYGQRLHSQEIKKAVEQRASNLKALFFLDTNLTTNYFFFFLSPLCTCIFKMINTGCWCT